MLINNYVNKSFDLKQKVNSDIKLLYLIMCIMIEITFRFLEKILLL